MRNGDVRPSATVILRFAVTSTEEDRQRRRDNRRHQRPNWAAVRGL